MCTLAVAHIKDYGWCSAKNRDRSMKVDIDIKRSMSRGIERCLLIDQNSKWSEGLNSLGVCISNVTLMNSKDTKESGKDAHSEEFASPGGKMIRIALFEKTVDKALKKMIDQEMEGFSVIFDKDNAYILEAYNELIDNSDEEAEVGEYKYHVTKCDKSKIYVRTNHGHHFKEAGYQPDKSDPIKMRSYESSISRHDTALKSVKSASLNIPRDLMNAISIAPHDDWMMNPVRKAPTHGKKIYVTTGQVLLVSSSKTVHYRPFWCNIVCDMNKMSNEKYQTHFEIISSNDLISTKTESLNGRSFKEWLN